MNGTKKVKQSVVLYADQLELVKQIAKELDTSVSAVIRLALRSYIDVNAKKRPWWRK